MDVYVMHIASPTGRGDSRMSTFLTHKKENVGMWLDGLEQRNIVTQADTLYDALANGGQIIDRGYPYLKRGGETDLMRRRSWGIQALAGCEDDASWT